MLNEEDLKRIIKLATQDAWKRDTHTTVNDMIEYIVVQASSSLLSELNSMQLQINDLVDAVISLSSPKEKGKPKNVN